ncbi:class I SAM-dependent methyltransferase [Bacillus stratosphericus]|uniref:class I SAM-dependent methyltransferase n=1 Tax=Bacillus stratosphericus TaxID=293386 RepID=UPI001CFBAE9C|nr:class I SAM-dependent methyltransferase [Bacillus stratosphericus]
MSTSTWKLIDDNIVVFDKKTGEPTELKHSAIVNSSLTYKYWDYLAWSAASLKNSEVLSVGFGAGTFAQLLEKWGIPSKGIGIEVDPNYKELNDSLTSYKVKYCDFTEGLSQIHNNFDTIIIDVYDENGYVDAAYGVEAIKTYLSLKKDNGRMVIHCLDILGTLLAAEVPLPTSSSILSTMIQRIKTVTDEPIYIVPLWSSYLIWVGPPPKSIETEKKPVKWLDTFLKSRMIKIDLPEGPNISELAVPWTYLQLEKINKGILLDLNTFAPEELKKFNILLNLVGPILKVKLSQKEINSIKNSLFEINNDASLHAASFILATIGNWTDAFGVLEGKKLSNPRWMKADLYKVK